MRATRPRVPFTEARNLNGTFKIPIDTSDALTGPFSEKRAKNSMAKAEAMIRFGIYITTLKNCLPLILSLTSVNQAASKREMMIR